MLTGAARVGPRSSNSGLAASPARWARGFLVGLVSGAGSVVAHQLVGGHSSLTVAAVVTVLSIAVGTALARWRIGLPVALALAVVAQATSHLLMVGSAGHHHDMQAQAGPDAAAGSGGTAMLLAHVAVALVTAVVSRGADQIVLDLVRVLVGWFLPRTWSPVLPPPQHKRTTQASDPRLLPSRLDLASPLTRRGPPVLTRLPITP